MIRDGLSIPLREALEESKQQQRIARREKVSIDYEGRRRAVNLQVVPLKNVKDPCYLIFFEEEGSAFWHATTELHRAPANSGEHNLPSASVEAALRDRIRELEQESVDARDYLASFQEHVESANEELQTSNEEVTSANEELQSVNEELETSKEEIESSNEELTTVNDELAERNLDLHRVNSDLLNFQTSTQLAIVLLGRDLAIRRTSAKAEPQLNVAASDVGRSFRHVRHNLAVPDLEKILTDVIDMVRVYEAEVQSVDGRWFLLRVRPYVTGDQKIEGAVLVLVDIHEMELSEERTLPALDYAMKNVDTVREAPVRLDLKTYDVY